MNNAALPIIGTALPIIGTAHFTLRDCRASPYGQYAAPVTDQKSTF